MQPLDGVLSTAAAQKNESTTGGKEGGREGGRAEAETRQNQKHILERWAWGERGNTLTKCPSNFMAELEEST